MWKYSRHNNSSTHDKDENQKAVRENEKKVAGEKEVRENEEKVAGEKEKVIKERWINRWQGWSHC